MTPQNALSLAAPPGAASDSMYAFGYGILRRFGQENASTAIPLDVKTPKGDGALAASCQRGYETRTRLRGGCGEAGRPT